MLKSMYIAMALGSLIVGHLNAAGDDRGLQEHLQRTTYLIKLGDKQAKEDALRLEDISYDDMDETDCVDNADDDDDGA